MWQTPALWIYTNALMTWTLKNDVIFIVDCSEETDVLEIVFQVQEPDFERLAAVFKHETPSKPFVGLANKVSVAYGHPGVLERFEPALVQRYLVSELPHRILTIRHLARHVLRILDGFR